MKMRSDSVNSSGSSDKSSQKSFFDRNLASIVSGKLGKMFVGGLGETTVENLRFYFAAFGEIEDVVIMRDTKTGLSRGFAFVTFVDPASIDKVLEVSEHFLDGKKIDPQHAIRNISPARSVHNIYKKIFIGGVSQQTTVQDLKQYFTENFGEVEDVVLKLDYPKRAHHRGFGFLTFFDNDVADQVAAVRYHQIGGKTVETKQAQKKEFVNLQSTATINLAKCSSSSSDNIFGFDDVFYPTNYCGFSLGSPMFTQPPPTFFHSNESALRKKLFSKYIGRAQPAFY